MKKYLLLRSNKQTGPYSLEEIQVMGLKAYDLVWVEGKSAAWRYPGEIEELKPFAPLVEEQPYDRFYKKTPSPAQSSSPKTVSPVSAKSESSTKAESESPFLEKKQEQRIPIITHVPATSYVVNPQGRSAEITRTVSEPPVDPGLANSNNHTVSASRPIQETAEPLKDLEHEQAEKALAARAARIQQKALSSSGKNPSWTNPVPIIWEPEPANRPGNSRSAEPRVAAKKSSGFSSFMRPFAIGFSLATFLGAGIVLGFYLSNKMRAATPATKDVAVKEDNPVGNRQTLYYPQQMQVAQEPSPVQPEGTQKSAGLGENLNTGREKDASSESAKTKLRHHLLDSIAVFKPKISTDSAAATASSQPSIRPSESSISKENFRENISHYVQLTGNNYSVGTFGGIDDLQLTVTNRSLFPLDLVVVEVQYIQSNKKIYKTENLLFKNIGAGSALMQEAPKSSRGVKVQYRITVINSKDLGISYSGI